MNKLSINTMDPKISIIMSVYNGHAHLRQSLDSISTQSFKDFEFIIVDDGSTDETPSLLREYSAKDTRIKIITNEKNIGLTKSLNLGIRASSGEYIARMDAGDTSEVSRFEKQVCFLDENPDYGLVGAWTRVIDGISNVVADMKYPTENHVLQKVLIRYNPFVHSSVMMRRSILEEAGLYDESWKYAQDYELFFRIARLTKIANLGEYLVSYRVYPKSITSTKNKQQTLFAIKARIKAIRRGQYGFFSYIYLLKPILGYIIPYSIKTAVKRNLKI